MTKLACFAYGSNMMSARLRYRVPTCAVVGIARLEKYQLRFHKRSVDRSGKCNAFFTGHAADAVLGVVYEIPENEKRALDRAEGVGVGYHEECLGVVMSDGALIEARTYLADLTHIDERLKPYSWYKDFVVSGAHEHGLPADYIASHIESVIAIPDPDSARERGRRGEVRHI